MNQRSLVTDISTSILESFFLPIFSQSALYPLSFPFICLTFNGFVKDIPTGPPHVKRQWQHQQQCFHLLLYFPHHIWAEHCCYAPQEHNFRFTCAIRRCMRNFRNPFSTSSYIPCQIHALGSTKWTTGHLFKSTPASSMLFVVHWPNIGDQFHPLVWQKVRIVAYSLLTLQSQFLSWISSRPPTRLLLLLL